MEQIAVTPPGLLVAAGCCLLPSLEKSLCWPSAVSQEAVSCPEGPLQQRYDVLLRPRFLRAPASNVSLSQPGHLFHQSRSSDGGRSCVRRSGWGCTVVADVTL